MGLKEELILACHPTLVELVAEVDERGVDDVARFLEAVRERIAEHQYQIMTDPTILYPEDLRVVTSLVSRDPLPGGVKDALLTLGFVPVGGDGGSETERSLFSRFQRGKKRTQLDKWQAPYLRAKDVSPKLGELEAALFEEMPREPLHLCHEQATRALVDNVRTAFRILLSPSFDGLSELESAIQKERASSKGRWVLHPSAVRAVAAFVGASLHHEASRTEWSKEGSGGSRLLIRASGGVFVESDPELRVIRFVREGREALLSDYARNVVEQSLTASAQS
jgi:hypothetical protein